MKNGVRVANRRTPTQVLFWACVLCGVLNALPVSSQGEWREEYRLKAAFVYRFPQFVEWPPAVLGNGVPLQICVSRPNPFGDALEQLTEGETLNGRPLVVREVAGAGAVDGCHVLFIPGENNAIRKALLTRAARRPVLTVGESPQFLEEGGIIGLRIVDRRVRFDVNPDAAARAGLKLSSQLLRLAASVRGTT